MSLDDKQLEQLMALQERYIYKPVRRKRRKFWSWSRIASFSVLLCCGIAVAVVMMTDAMLLFNAADNSSQERVASSVIQRIADEVVRKHLKIQPLEVETTEIMRAQRYFSELTFAPYSVQSLVSSREMTLEGGRYCFIQGARAAQLRYEDKKGGYVTLFETAYSTKVFNELPNINKGEEPVVTYRKGIKVSMWVEKSVVMVSAEKFR